MPRKDALAVLEAIAGKGIAVYGVEVWIPTPQGPYIPAPFIYTFTFEERLQEEPWDTFAKRSAQSSEENDPGTLEVYPLKQYGAVEVGEHRFCDARKFEKCGAQSGVAKFVMLWQNQDGKWKIKRVISYDHVSSN